jgi:hypothetical protein
MSPANEIEGWIEESEERRRQAEGNTGDAHTRRTQSRVSVSQGVDRVRERAKAKKKERFTSLLHLIDVERLTAAYLALKRDAAPGVDGVTWEQYGQNLLARPSSHAAWVSSIVCTLCPCCFATHSGFLPIIRFQLTHECRALRHWH